MPILDYTTPSKDQACTASLDLTGKMTVRAWLWFAAAIFVFLAGLIYNDPEGAMLLVPVCVIEWFVSIGYACSALMKLGHCDGALGRRIRLWLLNIVIIACPIGFAIIVMLMNA